MTGSTYIPNDKKGGSIAIPMEDQYSSSQGSNLNTNDTPKPKSTQQRPIFNHSSTSYATKPQPSQSQSQRYEEPCTYQNNQYQYQYHDTDSELPSKESSYPPTSETLHPHHVYTSNPSGSSNGSRRGGGRNRSVSLSLNEMWDKSRSVCNLKGEHAVGKSMMLGWILTTLAVLGVLGWWRKELFEALDNLSKYLSSSGYYGHLTIFILILITTIPPIPLYSTLIVLSGYTFGVWEGFIISYTASLVGAILVFVVSRQWLRDVIGRCLSCSPTSSTLLSILSTHPHLLLLIRIAPYPYNLLNVILASSPSLSLKTYTACTALSLCKLVLHTWIGAGIHNLSEAYGHSSSYTPDSDSDKDSPEIDKGESSNWSSPWHHHHPPPPHHGHPQHDLEWSKREDIKSYSTWIGIILCIVLFFYLTYIAKKAVKKAQLELEQEREREIMRECESGEGLLHRMSEEV